MQPVAQSGTTAGASHQALLTTYCYSCHNPRARMGGLALQGLDLQGAGSDAEIWEKAVRKLRGGDPCPLLLRACSAECGFRRLDCRLRFRTGTLVQQRRDLGPHERDWLSAPDRVTRIELDTKHAPRDR